MVKPLFLFPLNWSIVSPGKYSKSTVQPAVQVFARDVKGKSVYLRFPALVTYVLDFDVIVDDELVHSLSESLGITNIKLSPSNPYALIVRDHNFIPHTIDPALVCWKSALADPGGKLTAMWSFTDLAPFRWFKVTHYFKLTTPDYTTSDRAYTTQERFIVAVDHNQNVIGAIGSMVTNPSTSSTSNITYPLLSAPSTVALGTPLPKVLYWDLECYNKLLEFPSADNPDDAIFMVSLVTATEAILITSSPVYPEKITVPIPLIVEQVVSEKELIDLMMLYLDKIQPDYMSSYNGDDFDVPYLIRRAELNGVDWIPFGKVRKAPVKVKYGAISGMFGMSRTVQLQVTGSEWLDLLHYYKRYHPYMRNFRLNTVSLKYLGVGKTDMKITDLQNAVTNVDRDVLTRGGEYAVIDSLRLMQLWDTTGLTAKFYRICQAMRITPQTLLQASTSSVLTSIVAAIDPGALLLKGPSENIPKAVEAKVGIYRKVYGYQYTNLYLQLMRGTKSAVAVELVDRVSEAYPELIVAAYYSSYVDRSSVAMSFNFAMQQLISSNSIITMDSTYIRSYLPLAFPFLTEIERLDSYVAVSKASYLILDDDQLNGVGTSKICLAKCPWHKLNLSLWFKQYLTSPQNSYTFTPFPTDPNELVLTKKLTDRTSPSEPLLYQYGKPVNNWVVVNYVMTTMGPMLLSTFQNSPNGAVLDSNYYNTALMDDIVQLKKLPVYG